VIIKDVLLVDGLKHSLLSIIQLCDKGYKITFEPNHCLIADSKSSETVLVGKRVNNNVYMLNVSCITSSMNCLLTRNDKSLLWHRILAHIHMHHLNRIASKELVIRLPKLKFERDKLCEACQKGKQTKNTFKPLNVISNSRPLELLHMDLFGPSRTMSLGGNYYGLVIVDDYSRFTWTFSLLLRMKLIMLFKDLSKLFKMRRTAVFFPLNRIMEENSE